MPDTMNIWWHEAMPTTADASSAAPADTDVAVLLTGTKTHYRVRRSGDTISFIEGS